MIPTTGLPPDKDFWVTRSQTKKVKKASYPGRTRWVGLNSHGGGQWKNTVQTKESNGGGVGIQEGKKEGEMASQTHKETAWGVNQSRYQEKKRQLV